MNEIPTIDFTKEVSQPIKIKKQKVKKISNPSLAVFKSATGKGLLTVITENKRVKSE